MPDKTGYFKLPFFFDVCRLNEDLMKIKEAEWIAPIPIPIPIPSTMKPIGIACRFVPWMADRIIFFPCPTCITKTPIFSGAALIFAKSSILFSARKRRFA